MIRELVKGWVCAEGEFRDIEYLHNGLGSGWGSVPGVKWVVLWACQVLSQC